jgi:hypothetical protein
VEKHRYKAIEKRKKVLSLITQKIINKMKNVKIPYRHSKSFKFQAPDDFTLEISVTNTPRSAGTAYYYTFDMFIDSVLIDSLPEPVKGREWDHYMDLPYDQSIPEEFTNALLKAGYKVNNEYFGNDSAQFSKFHKLYVTKADNQTKIMLNNIKNIEPLEKQWKLGFNRFIDMDETRLIVEMYGHCVGGSYTYDWEVTPDYISRLQKVTCRKVEFLSHKNGGIAYDKYRFAIHLDNKTLKSPKL